MTIFDITTNPLLASTTVSLPSGLNLAVRPLLESDQEMFGEFLASLSPATNSLYQPHPLTIAAAKDICQNLNYSIQLPFVAVADDSTIVAYLLFDFRHSDPEAVRYKTYGVDLDFTIDCRFAPVVADTYQGQGLGEAIFKGLLPILSRLPLRSLVLWGGTQERNKRAIAFYKKIGFELMGEFDENGMRNYDMMLVLN